MVIIIARTWQFKSSTSGWYPKQYPVLGEKLAASCLAPAELGVFSAQVPSHLPVVYGSLARSISQWGKASLCQAQLVVQDASVLNGRKNGTAGKTEALGA